MQQPFELCSEEIRERLEEMVQVTISDEDSHSIEQLRHDADMATRWHIVRQTPTADKRPIRKTHLLSQGYRPYSRFGLLSKNLAAVAGSIFPSSLSFLRATSSEAVSLCP